MLINAFSQVPVPGERYVERGDIWRLMLQAGGSL